MSHTLVIDNDTLIYINITSNILSIIGCLFILAIYYLYYDQLKSFASKIIIYLTLSSLLFSISQILSLNLLKDPYNNTICFTQGFLSVYSVLSSILWTSVISFTLY